MGEPREVRHGTFVTEWPPHGFIARCVCGWENRAAGYDYGEALTIESTHPGPRLTNEQVLRCIIPTDPAGSSRG